MRARQRVARQGRLALLLAAAAVGGGCTTAGYYAQALHGHLALMAAARPVADWIADPATDAALRARLRTAVRIRRFAVDELALPDNASYMRYAALGRTAVVWNVVAAPELSLQLKTWCFPVMGCVSYRGYFDETAARAQARRLDALGWDTAVYGVPAYSTLGWSNLLGGDPLLDTFVAGTSDDDLAALMFHELAHQRVYAAGDTRFNESYATAVERIGTARWQAAGAASAAGAAGLPAARLASVPVSRAASEPTAADDPPPPEADPRGAWRRQWRSQWRSLTARTRVAMQQAYDGAASDAERRAAKQRVLARLRADYAAFRSAWQDRLPMRDGSAMDLWVAQANNASLAIQGVYDDAVPQFQAWYEAGGRTLPALHAAAACLAARPIGARWDELRGNAGPCWPGTGHGRLADVAGGSAAPSAAR